MKRKVLTNKSLEVITKDACIVCKWIMNHFPRLLPDFMQAFTVMIKTSQTIPMDTLFKPVILSGIVINDDVLSALTTFTQTTTLYKATNEQGE